MVSLAEPRNAPTRLSDRAVILVEELHEQPANYTLSAQDDLCLSQAMPRLELRSRSFGHSSTPTWLRRVVDQLSTLVSLRENWDSYGAPPLDHRLLVSAVQLLDRTMRHETPAPMLVPLSVGGLQLEWHQHGMDIEVEVTAPHRISVFCRDRVRGEEWDEIVDEDGGRLRRCLGELTERRLTVLDRAG